MKTILVTGGAGFIGSNFIPYFLEEYSDYRIINLDVLTYAGTEQNLKELVGHPRYEFVKGDICDTVLVDQLFKKHSISGVIHFAAESHVDNSITGPEAFIRTNIVGTFNLLDVARKNWMKTSFVPLEGKEENRFLHISTDEVYGSLGREGFFTEATPYAPNSPYSASKASSDLLVRSYHHTYGLNVVTTNCSNNYGPKQHAEKLIPTIVRNAIREQSIPIYGDGENVRDWLYVLDHARGIALAFLKGRSGETYNIGGRNERTNNQIVNVICTALDERHPRKNGTSYKALITYVKDRAGHDKRYAIDATKIETELSWKAEENFESGIRKTLEWYLKSLV
jgi:dTDP-glucose 4,6-dehydratase